MKKFSFSLGKVLTFKLQTLDVLKNELSVLQQQLSKIESEIKAQEQLFNTKNTMLVEKLNKGTTTADINSYKVFLNNISENIKKLNQTKEMKNFEIAKKHTEIIKMNIEIGSLEKLKEKQLNEYNQMLAKAQEAEIEEFVSNAMANY